MYWEKYHEIIQTVESNIILAIRSKLIINVCYLEYILVNVNGRDSKCMSYKISIHIHCSIDQYSLILFANRLLFIVFGCFHLSNKFIYSFLKQDLCIFVFALLLRTIFSIHYFSWMRQHGQTASGSSIFEQNSIGSRIMNTTLHRIK